MNYSLAFYTQYHQFFIADKEFKQDTSDEEFWTETASQTRLAIGDGILGVGTECYGHFKGELIVLDSKNDNVELSEYDHVVEGGINISSGILHILDCPNSHVELEIRMTPGQYRVKIYSSNLASVVDDSGDDFYKIEIWPDINMERVILKQYPSSKVSS